MAEGLAVLLHLTSPPGYDWLVIVETPGLVLVLEGDSLLPEPFLDLRNEVNYPTHNEQGLLGLEFDPNFEANGIFYANYTDLDGNTGLSRFRVGPDPRRADRATEERLFSIPRLLEHHNAGKIQFGPDGYMWISTGDGFDSGTAQDPTNLRGSIIRIDVNGAYPYGIPPDNPFVSDPEALPEIWMYGLRNPWRFHIDREEGLAYIPDVGHHRREEINIVPWNSPGTNFGWAVLDPHETSTSANVSFERLLLRLVQHVLGGIEEHEDGVAAEVVARELARVLGDVDAEAFGLRELTKHTLTALDRGVPEAGGPGEDEDAKCIVSVRDGGVGGVTTARNERYAQQQADRGDGAGKHSSTSLQVGHVGHDQ